MMVVRPAGFVMKENPDDVKIVPTLIGGTRGEKKPWRALHDRVNR